MSIFTQNTPHKKKSSKIPRLNRSNPLSKYLAGGWYFTETNGDYSHDISNYNHGNITGSTVGYESTKNGNVLVSTGDAGSDRVDVGSITSANPLSLFGANTALIIARVYLDETNATSGDPVLIGKLNGAAGAGGWVCSWNVSVNRWYFSVAGASNYVGSSDGDRWVTVAYWCTAATTDIYEDGLLLGTAGGLLGSVPSTTTSASIANAPVGTDNQWVRNIDYVLVFKDIPSDQARIIKSLYDNPWQLIESDKDFIYIEDAAPAVGAIMSQFQGSNLGADLYNGTLI